MRNFLSSLEDIAQRRVERDSAAGISPPDTMLPVHDHWRDLHRSIESFQTRTRSVIDLVVDEANSVLSPVGFRIAPVDQLRLLRGETSGLGYLIASDSGIAPNGMLTFKLIDNGCVRIEAEGLRLELSMPGGVFDFVEVRMADVDEGLVRATILSFVKESLDGPQHAFAEE